MLFSTPVNGNVGLFQSRAAGGNCGGFDCGGLPIGLSLVKYCWMCCCCFVALFNGEEVVVFVAGTEDLGDEAVFNIFWRCCRRKSGLGTTFLAGKGAAVAEEVEVGPSIDRAVVVVVLVDKHGSEGDISAEM